jgi:hypothetical protein
MSDQENPGSPPNQQDQGDFEGTKANKAIRPTSSDVAAATGAPARALYHYGPQEHTPDSIRSKLTNRERILVAGEPSRVTLGSGPVSVTFPNTSDNWLGISGEVEIDMAGFPLTVSSVSSVYGHNLQSPDNARVKVQPSDSFAINFKGRHLIIGPLNPANFLPDVGSDAPTAEQIHNLEEMISTLTRLGTPAALQAISELRALNAEDQAQAEYDSNLERKRQEQAKELAAQNPTLIKVGRSAQGLCFEFIEPIGVDPSEIYVIDRNSANRTQDQRIPLSSTREGNKLYIPIPNEDLSEFEHVSREMMILELSGTKVKIHNGNGVDKPSTGSLNARLLPTPSITTA